MSAKAPLTAIHCAHDAVVAAGTLKPHPENMNEHPQEQVERLADILFGPKDPKKKKRSGGMGWRLPVTVSKRSGFIIRGHGRWLAAVLAKEPVPVNHQHYASEAEEIADLLADKRASEGSTWNIELAAGAFDKVQLAGLDVRITGFEEVTMEELKAGPKLPAPGAGKGKGGGSRKGPGNPVIAYNLQFDTDEQQQQWFLFLRKLNATFPEEKTIAGRLALWLTQHGELE